MKTIINQDKELVMLKDLHIGAYFKRCSGVESADNVVYIKIRRRSTDSENECVCIVLESEDEAGLTSFPKEVAVKLLRLTSVEAETVRREDDYDYDEEDYED